MPHLASEALYKLLPCSPESSKSSARSSSSTVTPDGARLAVRAPRLAPLASDRRLDQHLGLLPHRRLDRRQPASLRGGARRRSRRTSLGKLAVGSRVNLEDALRAGEPFGGHLVQGHVDGVGEISEIRPEGDGYRIAVRVPADLMRYLAEKGSIAVAGISLTVAALRDDGFEVALIPHTWTSTTVSDLEVGDPVNLEVDVIAKYVERLLP